MLIIGLKINDSIDYTQWFEETFLIADISQSVGLEMPFLKLSDSDFS